MLGFIEDVIGPGTVLIFDDWYSFRNDGGDIEQLRERQAFNEWHLRDRFDPLVDAVNISKAFVMRGEHT